MKEYEVLYTANPVIDDKPPFNGSAFVEASNEVNAAAGAQFVIGDSVWLHIISVKDRAGAVESLRRCSSVVERLRKSQQV